MLKKLLLTSFFLFSLFSIFYPTNKENTKLFDYCYSLEKILSKNSLESNKNLKGRFKSISIDLAKIGVDKTKGSLINQILNQYKKSKKSLIIKIIPNKIYCFSGYWIEKVKPGTFESIFYEQSKKSINELKDLKDEVDEILNDINSEYKSIKEELNNIF